MRDRRRVDWHRVFDDFAHLGMTGDELAEKAGLAPGTLKGIAEGRDAPPPRARNQVVWLWCHLTGKEPQHVPRTGDPIGTARPEVPGIESNEEREPSYAQLQSIVMTWSQIVRSA